MGYTSVESKPCSVMCECIRDQPHVRHPCLVWQQATMPHHTIIHQHKHSDRGRSNECQRTMRTESPKSTTLAVTPQTHHHTIYCK